ncbi:hypothetical protein ACXATD_003332 [Clostridium sporogenes]
MNQMEKEKITISIADLLKDKKCSQIILEALYTIKPSLKRVMFLTVSIFLLLNPLINMAFSKDTISKFIKMIDISNTVILVLLGMTFTGFSLFQALATKSTLKQLLINKVKDKSLFKEYNLFFFGINIINLIIIILNFCLTIFMNNIPKNWSLPFFNTKWNNYISLILIILYVILNLFAISEIKSFLYNIYQCFSLNAASNVIDDMKNEEK